METFRKFVLRRSTRRFILSASPLLRNRVDASMMMQKRLFSYNSASNARIIYRNAFLMGRHAHLHSPALCYSTTIELESYDDFLEKVLNSEVPVIVDFYADWCGPCVSFGPRLQAKVEGRNGEVALVKVNMDAVGGCFADEFEIRALPTVIAFKNGEMFMRIEGSCDDEEIDALMDDLIKE